ncbi:MAG: DUF2339 domain-containing protein [Desulfuromonadales bacterium]
MKIVATLIGVLAGAFLYSSHHRFLLGALIGGLLVWLWMRLQHLQARLSDLEYRLNEALQSPEKDKRATEPRRAEAPGEATAPSEEFLFESEPLPAPPSAVARPAPPSPRPTAPRLSPKPAQKPVPQIELWNILVSYFTGGNVVVRAGVVVLFFGVAFLLKYSAERNIIPIEIRLLGIGLGAIALLLLGWRLRTRKPAYALIVQGAGVGILYLTIFAAMRLYHLLPAGLVLPLLVTLSIFSATLAIVQDARSLAVIGILGGFLAPILTSTGGGSHIMLFSYYALLNAGIFYTAWHRSWRELNLLGFIFTFAIGALWGHGSYRPELFSTTEPFLILFFLFYFALGILFARNQPFDFKGYVDGTLVFGTPIVCFGLQAALVRPYEYGLAWTALAAGLLYTGTAWALFRRGGPAMRTLVEAFMATGVVLGTIAIPLALDGRWTSAAWALEGAAIVWLALRKGRWMPRAFGLALQPLAGFAFLTAAAPTPDFPLVNSAFLGCLAVAFAGFFSAGTLYRYRDSVPTVRLESALALVWALLWWFGGGLQEIDTFVHSPYRPATRLVFFALSAAFAFFIGEKQRWEDMKHVYKALLPAMILSFIQAFWTVNGHPFAHGGVIAWPLAFGVLYALLHRDRQGSLARHLATLHLGTLLLLIGLVTWEAAWWTNHLVHGSDIWPLVTGALVPGLFVLVLSRRWNSALWPLTDYRRTYLVYGLTPVVFALWVGSIQINLINAGGARPLPYLPLINPLDLTQAFVLLAMGFWSTTLTRHLGERPFGLERVPRLALFGGTIFFWLNAVLIRTLHHWGGVRFSSQAMADSDLVQTSLSIFWTLSALMIMLWASRRQVRVLWLVGAGLVAVVILKLFAVDLANTSTVERIVSFIGVGVICLVIGYLAPLPLRSREGSETS